MTNISAHTVSSPAGTSWPALRKLQLWLFALASLVLCMVVVGGATRLTHSGLTITQWNPLMGAVPPLSAADWDALFAKYRQIPEYQQLNNGMTLAEFKPLFWWEWSHRLLGRFIGLVAGLGVLYFLLIPEIRRRYWRAIVGIFALGALEGLAGWYMVMSGLQDRTDVSQYRLTLHLGIATLIIGFALWTALGVGRNARSPVAGAPAALAWLALALIGAVYGQILLGGFVAGLDAGLSYNTWPLMDGHLIPHGLRTLAPRWTNLFENPIAVQFDHRVGAYGVALLALVNHLMVWRKADAQLLASAAAVLTLVLLQISLGIWTLLAIVPLPLALSHQLLAMAVLGAAIFHLHRTVRVP